MARRVEVHLIDDIGGGKADETVRFGLDGVNYEIDLSAKNAGQLRSAFAKYVGAGTRLGRGQVVTTGRGRRGAAPAHSDRAQNQAIREWAKRKKIGLSDRGRIPRHIVEQYQAEAGR
jgi:nucleoid-associated protein Lsr2